MNIIIPTYPPHFLWNKLFIQSFKKYCIDYQNCSIEFIVNNNDLINFKNIMGSLLDNNVKVKVFENILLNQGQQHIFYPQNIYEKYSFQAIKKMFAVLDSEQETNLVLDSENIAVKNFYFEELFKNKNTFYCSWVVSDIQQHVVNGCNNILKTNNNKWFFETSYWIYNKKIFQNIISHILKINNLSKEALVPYLKNIIFFEKNLYDLWLVQNNLIDNLLNEKDCLYSFESLNVSNQLLNKNITTEHIISYLNDEKEINSYIKFVNGRQYNIFRVNELTNDYFLKKIVSDTDAKILTVFDNKNEIYDYWSYKTNG